MKEVPTNGKSFKNLPYLESILFRVLRSMVADQKVVYLYVCWKIDKKSSQNLADGFFEQKLFS